MKNLKNLPNVLEARPVAAEFRNKSGTLQMSTNVKTDPLHWLKNALKTHSFAFNLSKAPLALFIAPATQPFSRSFFQFYCFYLLSSSLLDCTPSMGGSAVHPITAKG